MKSGDPSLLTNLPTSISVLSFFSKVFERIVYDYLISFVQIIYCMIISLDSDQDIPPNKQ